MRRGFRGISLGVGVCVIAAVSSTWILAGPAAASTCSPTGALYYTPVNTLYAGGIDGSQATVSVTTTSPYVCDLETDHSLETSALVLPKDDDSGNQDTIENGATEGHNCTLQGTCQNTSSNSLYFYQEANLFSKGTSTLNIEGSDSGSGNHAYSVQEVVSGCPSACQLFGQFVTDNTTWARISLPAGDNPGHVAAYQGEVLNNPSDQMGTATILVPQVHAGTWSAWSGMVYSAASTYYCNVNYAGGGMYSYQNWGPEDPQYHCE
jgi:hypothetical protein